MPRYDYDLDNPDPKIRRKAEEYFGLNKKEEPRSVYKTPLAQAEAISKVPQYSKDALVKYLKNFGSGFDDDAYEEWANKKGKPLQGKPLNPEFLKTDFAKQWYGDRTETYKDQYLNDDEWLQEMWPDVAEDALEYYNSEKEGK